MERLYHGRGCPSRCAEAWCTGAQMRTLTSSDHSRGEPMLDMELFALLERTADASYTVSGDGTICSWNAAAERLFGYAAEEVIGRSVDDVLDARDSLGTDALAG